MSFLLKARFNSKGCSTDSNVKSLGGVSFTEASPLYNGDKSVYFEPANDSAGIEIMGNTRINISNHLGSNLSEFTIYLKYRINGERLDRDEAALLPIISYLSPTTGFFNDLLSIEAGQYFTFSIDQSEFYSSKVIDYTFDDTWHTLVVTKNGGYIKFFIDGFLSTTNPYTGNIPITNTAKMYIGLKDETNKGDHFTTLSEVYLDDICIIDRPVYLYNFLPPNNYFVGDDLKGNYYTDYRTDTNIIDMSQMPKYVADQAEKKLPSTAFRINEKQKGWLPRRLRIQWHEEDMYFKQQEFYRMSDTRTYTAISLFGLEQPLLMETEGDRFIDVFNAEEALSTNKIMPFMLFIDKKFVKLSDLYIMKSDQYYTIFIKGRTPNKYTNMIKSVELVIIPFPVIYEEEMGEREGIVPLYVFDKEGYFCPANGFTYYYIDPTYDSGTKTSGIYEYSTSTSIDDGEDTNTDDDSMYLHNYWRYGTFTSLGGNYYKFTTSDSIVARSGDKINLYKNTTLIDERRYTIVGDDTFLFNSITDGDNDLLGRSITMQMITDTRTISNIYIDMTTMKERTISATKNNQSVFTIPTVVDSDGYLYTNFLVFKDTICMNGQDRFHIGKDKNSIVFNDTSDFLAIGETVTFIFLKLTKSDQYGQLHAKPIYLYTRTGDNGVVVTNNMTTSIIIPNYRNLTYSKENIFFFVNGTFVSPSRYTISNNRVDLIDTANDKWITGKGVTFVLLKMVSEIDDPTGPRGEIVKHQIKQGNRFILFDLNIDKHVKITLDNFVVFDQNGKYLPEIIGEVYNMNVVKSIKSSIDPLHTAPRYLTCVYSAKKSLPNEANIMIPNNDSFIKDYISLYQEFYELDGKFDQFISDFELLYSKDKHYGQNLSMMIWYMISYNEWKFLDIYKKKSTIQRLELDTTRLNNKIKNAGIQGPVRMDRSKFDDSYYRTYCMFFEDGIIPEWQGSITYKQNELTLRFKSQLSSSSKIEVLKFHKMKNFLEKLNNTVDDIHN